MNEKIDAFFPQLQSTTAEFYDKMVLLAVPLLLAGLIFKLYQSSDPAHAIRSIVAIGIAGIALAFFPDWSNQLQVLIYDIMDDLDAHPAETHTRFASLVRGAAAGVGQDSSLIDRLFGPNGGLGDVILYAIVYLTAKCAQLIMWVAFIAQQILMLSGVSVAPLFIASLLVPSLGHTAAKYFTSLAAVALFPLGWGFASAFTDALLRVAAEDGADLIDFGADVGLSFVISLWLLISTIAAPFIIWKVVVNGANIGGQFIRSVGQALGSTVVYGAGSAVTAVNAQTSRKVTATAAFAGGASGMVTGSAQSSGMMVPAFIGLGAVMASRNSAPVDHNAKAEALHKKYS